MLSDEGTDRLIADVLAMEDEAEAKVCLFQTLWDAPMSDRGRLTVRSNEVKLSGLDHGHTVIRSINTVTALGTVLTLHEAGSTHWVGRGMERGYSSAVTFTVLIEPDTVHYLNKHIRAFRYVRLSRPVEVKTSVVDRDRVHQLYFARLQEDA